MRKGFTLIEIIIVVSVTLILLALGVVNLSQIRNSASTDSVLELLLSDIKLQQMKAMTGDTSAGSDSSGYGIYFTGSEYTLFKGDTYSAGDPANFTITLSSDLQFSSIEFPSSQLIFEKGSGEIVSFNPDNDSITLTNTVSNDNVVITLNKYGVFTNIE